MPQLNLPPRFDPPPLGTGHLRCTGAHGMFHVPLSRALRRAGGARLAGVGGSSRLGRKKVFWLQRVVKINFVDWRYGVKPCKTSCNSGEEAVITCNYMVLQSMSGGGTTDQESYMMQCLSCNGRTSKQYPISHTIPPCRLTVTWISKTSGLKSKMVFHIGWWQPT